MTVESAAAGRTSVSQGSTLEEITVRTAREQFFAELHYANDGGYQDKIFRIKLGPVAIPLPNTQARIRAVQLHDLHHVATGYQTHLVGEAEISAWELASNCRAYIAAWVLNFAGFCYGLFLAPRRIYRAFLRGRHSRNLYTGSFHEQLLDLRLSELRRQLALDAPMPRATLMDQLVFGAFALAALVALALPFLFAVWLFLR